MESEKLDHNIICGILKTILLFLEGQNLHKTSEIFLSEAEQLGFTTIRSAVAQVLILKPAVAEIVTVTRAGPEVDFVCRCYNNEEGKSDNQKECQKEKNPSDTIKSKTTSSLFDSESSKCYGLSNVLVQNDQNKSVSEYQSEFDSNKSLNPTSDMCIANEANCFPCEECNEITPISSQSVPIKIPNDDNQKEIDPNEDNCYSAESIKDDKSTKLSVTFTSQAEISEISEKDLTVPEENLEPTRYDVNDRNKSVSVVLEKKSQKYHKERSKSLTQDFKFASISYENFGSDDNNDGNNNDDDNDDNDCNEYDHCNFECPDENNDSDRRDDYLQRLKNGLESKSSDFQSKIQNLQPNISDVNDLKQNDNDYDQFNDSMEQIDGNLEEIDSNLDQIDNNLDQIDSNFDQIDDNLCQNDNLFQNDNLDQIDDNLDQIDDYVDEDDVDLDQNDDDIESEIADMTQEWINGLQFDVSVGPPNAGEVKSKELDYYRLKQDLNLQNDEVKLLLLQALRWRITKSSPDDREKSLINLAKHDLLGLHGNNTCQNNSNPNNNSLLTNCLLTKTHPNQLQESISRLLNALASNTLGRDYLCQDDRNLRFTIIPLITGKHKTTISDVTKEHLLATLQKLSLRSKMRMVMIETGLPEYLVEFISNKHEKLTDYCLEYTCALFMNLCLHKDTRLGMKNVCDYLINMLIVFISSNHDHCLPYINGAMYSLFNEDFIREQAKNSPLYQVLQEKIKNFDGDIKLQFELIINVLNEGKITFCEDCDKVEITEDNEIDHIEPEIDLDDTTTSKPNGEDLLKNYFIKDPNKNSSLTCLCLPITPYKKITVKSFCSGQNDKYFDAILRNVSEIDKEIAENSKLTPKIPTKDENINVKAKLKDKSTQNNFKNKAKSEYRDRYDPSVPIIYEPSVQCRCIGRECRKRMENMERNCQRNNNNRYECGCYLQMKKFVENNCEGCGCSVLLGKKEKKDSLKLYQFSKSSINKTLDEDLFKSAVELIALSCCKSDHIDCECYSTVFQSRPRIHRTP